jgi:hypothetical protein
MSVAQTDNLHHFQVNGDKSPNLVDDACPEKNRHICGERGKIPGVLLF